MVVQMPGWTDLANAHITIFGDVYPLPPEMQSTARDVRRNPRLTQPCLDLTKPCLIATQGMRDCDQAV